MTTVGAVVAQAMRNLRISPYRLKRGEKESRRLRLIERRSIVRAAFELVRYSGDEEKLKGLFLRALSQDMSISNAALNAAKVRLTQQLKQEQR